MERSILIKLITLLIIALSLGGCATISPAGRSTIASMPAMTDQPGHPSSPWNGNTTKTWEKLQHTSPARLSALKTKVAHEPEAGAWLKLALISKHYSTDTPALSQALLAWRTQYPVHPANQLLPKSAALKQIELLKPPQHIAVLLPLTGKYQKAGQSIRAGLLTAYFTKKGSTDKQQIKFYDTNQSTSIPVLYQNAISAGADIIIGPLLKEDVRELANNRHLSLPTLALNYTDSQSRSPITNLYQFGLKPEDEIEQIADRARSSGTSRALIIAPENTLGKRMVHAFSTQWQQSGGNVQDVMFYSSHTDFTQEIARFLHINPDQDNKLSHENNQRAVLEQQRRQDFDVVFLFAEPSAARIIVPLLRFNYVTKIPIYATSSVNTGAYQPMDTLDLKGVIICDIPRESTAATTASPNHLQALGKDAFVLSQSLTRLQVLPDFPIYGSTGALTLSAQHNIHRRLPCTTVQNGFT